MQNNKLTFDGNAYRIELSSGVVYEGSITNLIAHFAVDTITICDRATKLHIPIMSSRANILEINGEVKTFEQAQVLIEDALSSAGGASSADKVSYDNTNSGLTATNVQGAIDEIGANLGGFQKVTYTELVALRDGKKLVGGKKYRITDYECTSSDEETQCAGHNYDIIVTALDDETLSEECSAIQHEGDTYFNGQNLNSWKVWYCLDNDASRFSWAKQGGKGVVYRLIDDKGNDVSYDFKNLMFKRYKITSEDSQFFGRYYGVKNSEIYNVDEEDYQFFYTFSVEEESVEDYSITNFVHSNKLYGNGNYNNIFVNTFGDECYSNTFGNDCYSNTFGNYCYSNTFGNYCYSNTFGNDCDSNTFGNYCYYNTFGDECYSNTFGDECGSNTFGNYCDSNTFGNECYSNTFGNYCGSNTFGGYCNSNTFDVSKTYNSCVVLDNVSEQNFSFVDYQDYDKNNYVQYCGYNSQGVLKYWTPADLVQ